MSKIKLKKELSKFTAEELREMILDLYAARKEVKEYFEFYMNPDIEKLNEKYFKVINKELQRTKWGYSKARVTKIKKAIKDFDSFSPGYEAQIDFRIAVLRLLCLTETYNRFTPPQLFLITILMVECLDIADRNMILDSIMNKLRLNLIDEPVATKSTKKIIANELQNYLESKSI